MGVIGSGVLEQPRRGILDPYSEANAALGDYMILRNGATNSVSTAWPGANKAIYLPVAVQYHVTVYQISVRIQTQSGNIDVGIYDESGTRIVSAGSTAMAAAGVQTFNVADTPLVPGTYFVAVNVSTTSAVLRGYGGNYLLSRASGVAEQNVGATALPATATFAAMSVAFVPRVGVSYYATAL